MFLSNFGLKLLRHKMIRGPWSSLFGRRYLLQDRDWPLYLDLGDIRGPSAFILKNGLLAYEPESFMALTPYLAGSGTFMDVGANIGPFSLRAAKGRPKLHVAAFEPHPFLHSLLQSNVNLHGLGNVATHALALSDRTGSLDFYESNVNSGGHSLLGASPIGDRSLLGPVQVLRADDLGEPVLRRPVLAMKIDVEGYELQVFRGAEALLRSDHPAIVFEHSPWAYKELGQDPIEGPLFLENLGYRFRWLDGGPGEGWIPTAKALLERLAERPFSQILAVLSSRPS